MGVSMAPITPSTAMAPNNSSSGTSSPIAIVAAASPLAATALENCVEASSRRRSIRSASVPATGARRTARPDRTVVVIPTTRALPVISYTSHSSAMRCVHIPVACRNCAPA